MLVSRAIGRFACADFGRRLKVEVNFIVIFISELDIIL
jgi:hypothetical protein